MKFGDRHGIFKEEVGDHEGKGARGWENIKYRHCGWYVADDPGRQLSFWHKHGHWEDDAEKSKGVERKDKFPEQEEEEDEICFFPEGDLDSEIGNISMLYIQVFIGQIL
jgi:hypothetical protein